MTFQAAIVIASLIVVVATVLFFSIRSNVDVKAQKDLDKYMKHKFSNEELGRLYERYIGHLYESDGSDVVYHGALNGFDDLGRDLIVRNQDEVFIVQTKYWAKFKQIKEKHIFNLFGTMTHYKLTSIESGRSVRAVLYTSATYSDVARDAAKVLGVELRALDLDKTYPMVKCNISSNGEKYYHLPFDPYYDKVKINVNRGECFVRTIKDAVEKGFRRVGAFNKAA